VNINGTTLDRSEFKRLLAKVKPNSDR
jgi:hypothetical protein